MKRTKKITILLCILIHDIILIPNDSCSRTLRYTPSGHSGRAVQNTKLSYFNKLLTHFSYIKYFAISIYFLSRLHKKNYRYKPCNAFEQKDYIQIDTAFFFHNKTKSCLHNVLYTKSLKPIIALLQETYDHLNIQDHNFIHEIFLLIFTVHKQILLQECKEHHHVLKKATLTTIIEVSDKINQLPIAEVLSAIDMLMTELPPFLEKYELTSAITWQNWLKKYWWVPPVFGGWFALKILLNFQRAYFYDYRHGHHRPSRLSTDTIITDPELLKIMRDKDDQK